jgi:hypothetical protein
MWNMLMAIKQHLIALASHLDRLAVVLSNGVSAVFLLQGRNQPTNMTTAFVSYHRFLEQKSPKGDTNY